jgi:glycosyltransferase involved in cell wall biosynthesis
MTRVLMFGWEYPPYVAGGLATATVGLVKGLAANAIEVSLVVPFPASDSGVPGVRLVPSASARGAQRRYEVDSVLEGYTTEVRHRAVVGELERRAPRIKGLYGRDLMAEVDRYASVAGAIAGREPHDVIDVHDWLTFGAGIEARRVSGKPLVAHIHATEYDRLGEHANPLVVARERVGLLAADRIIANSHAIAAICRERYDVPAERISVIHWGIDPDGLGEPSPPDNPLRVEGAPPPTVLFLGRVTRQKGPESFVEAAGLIATRVPEARYVLAGTGDLLPWAMERAAELGIADRMFFTGGVSPAEAARLYGMADVCVMPSVSEPFGLVALESLRLGTPVLIPRTSGVAEVVRNALRIDHWDVERIAALVVSLLRFPALREELSTLGAEELAQSRFGLDEPARRTRAVYADVIRAASAAEEEQ